MTKKKHPTIVWKDSRVGYRASDGGHTLSEKTGGIAFGGAVIFEYKSGQFFVPLYETTETRNHMKKLGSLGEAIVRNISNILGVDQVRIQNNYELCVEFTGVYKWNERRPYVIDAICKACEDNGYSLEEMPEDWQGKATTA